MCGVQDGPHPRRVAPVVSQEQNWWLDGGPMRLARCPLAWDTVNCRHQLVALVSLDPLGSRLFDLQLLHSCAHHQHPDSCRLELAQQHQPRLHVSEIVQVLCLTWGSELSPHPPVVPLESVHT